MLAIRAISPETLARLIYITCFIVCTYRSIKVTSITRSLATSIFDLQLGSIEIKYFSYRSLHDHLLFGFTYDFANSIAIFGFIS